MGTCRSGPCPRCSQTVIWIAAWLVEVMAWSLIAAVRAMMKPSRPLGIVWLVIAVVLIASGLFVADEAWSEGAVPAV